MHRNETRELAFDEEVNEGIDEVVEEVEREKVERRERIRSASGKIR